MIRYEKPSKTLSEHKKQAYNAFWCISDPYFYTWKIGSFGIFRIFGAKTTAKNRPKSQKCASTEGLRGAVHRRVLARKPWWGYEKPSNTLPEHTKLNYNAFGCISESYFFHLKNGHFWDFFLIFCRNFGMEPTNRPFWGYHTHFLPFFSKSFEKFKKFRIFFIPSS
jgi:hypothetical protein